MRSKNHDKNHISNLNRFFKKAMGMIAVLMTAGILISFVFITASANDANTSELNETTGTTETTETGEQHESGTKTVRVGWFDSAYCYMDMLGRRSGIAYEYQQKLAAYTGWDYEYVEGTWPELLQMLINGEIDMLSDVSYTTERADKILYPSVPMGSEAYYIFVRAGNTEMYMDDLSSFNGKIFGVDKDTVMERLIREWAERNRLDIKLRLSTDLSVDESVAKLQNGQMDAYVTVDAYGDRENCIPLCQIGSSDYYFAVSNKRPDLLQELNAALTTIQNEDSFYNQRLLQKYIWKGNSNAYLAGKEISWLTNHGKIRVGYRNNYLPFCGEENGNLTGALMDFLSKSETKLRNAELEFEAIPFATTDGCLKALEEGDVDLIFPINLSPYEMESRGLLNTERIMHTEIFAVVREGNGGDIFKEEGVMAALLSGNVNFDIFVQDYYPGWSYQHLPTLDDCYKAVSLGNADCGMVNSYRVTENERLIRRYNLSLLATGHDMDLSFAVKKGNKELYSIMNKIIYLTDEAETETDLSRYATISGKITFEDYLYDNAASVVAILAIFVSLILFLMLTKYRSDKRAQDRQKLITATELDPLTKLYTSNYFLEYAARMHKENPEFRLDAVALNIEQFHVVNAIYGWDFGDKILKAIGDEIKKFIDENKGIACRTQADKYEIYCPCYGEYQAMYDRLQRSLDEYSDNINIRIRMGIMPYQPGLEPIDMFDRARTACGMVRGDHKIRMMIFNEEMREREILEQRFLNDLKHAIENEEFVVYYQPKYNVQDETPVLESAEALVRWNHPELGMIPPVKFVGLFEKHGQIGEIDKFVWKKAAGQVSEWKKKYGRTIPISVNMSRIDIFDPNLVQTINDIIEQNGLSRSDIHLEVTESAYTEDTDQIIGVVRNLRELGYYIDMDDFGTGYSSLNMLSSMPVDILKLDKSFIDKIEKSDEMDEKDIRMVELILDIAKSLKLIVVAEGVENENQLVFLKDHGCEIIQGHYFSPPIPAEEFEKLAFEAD